MRLGQFWSALITVLLATTILVARPSLSIAQALDAPGPAPLVLLVRHAEKASEPADDPPLTSTGVERARALAAALRDSDVTAAITTQLRRTRETAQPLAEARGLSPVTVPVRWDDVSEHAKEVAAAVRRHTGGAVLVVGHSNTIPAIIAALGGPSLPDIRNTAHANLFVLIPGTEKALLVQSCYGAPDPDPGPECK